MAIPSDVRERIIAAAEDLYAKSGREAFPTVDQVRRAARADMNATSTVMREWRRQQTAQAAPVAVAVPEAVAQIHAASLATLWQQAQEAANESLRAAQASWEADRAELEALRHEMAAAYETQAQELEQASARAEAAERALQEHRQEASAELAALQQKLVAAEARAEAVNHQLAELKKEHGEAQAVASEARERAATLAGRLESVEAQNAAFMDRLAGTKS